MNGRKLDFEYIFISHPIMEKGQGNLKKKVMSQRTEFFCNKNSNRRRKRRRRNVSTK